jgi:hypothetical protein
MHYVLHGIQGLKCYWFTIYVITTIEPNDDESNTFNHEISQEESNLVLFKPSNIWISATVKKGKLSY